MRSEISRRLMRHYSKHQALYLSGPGALRPIGANGIYAVVVPLPGEASVKTPLWREVDDERMKNTVGADHLLEPVEPKGDLLIATAQAIPAVRFPTLEYCSSCSRLQIWTHAARKDSALAQLGECAYASENTKHPKKQTTRQVERVWVCQVGHLDELTLKDIHECEHGGNLAQLSKSKEAADESIYFKCSSCDKSSQVRLGDSKPCTGRYPQKIHGSRGGKCAEQMILLRAGAPEIWQPRMVTALFMPEILDLSEAEVSAVKAAMILPSTRAIESKRGKLENIQGRLLDAHSAVPWEKLEGAFDVLSNSSKPTASSFVEMKVHELSQLKKLLISDVSQAFFVGTKSASTQNLSPVKAVSPIERLRTTTCLTAASRAGGEPTSGVLHAMPYGKGGSFMAFEAYGEGLLLWVDPKRLHSGHEEKALHSLSHAILRSLGEVAGVSLGSIQERIYWSPATPAILLYTATGDRVGTLGGLASLGFEPEILDEIIAEQLLKLSWCSLDPACWDGGGACHHCLHLPETCCETNGSGTGLMANEGISRKFL